MTGQVHRRSPPDGVIPLYLDLSTPFDSVGSGYDAIIHLAAIAHSPVDEIARAMLKRVNVAATAMLAHAAAKQKAHFVFLSSAKVMGEQGSWNDSMNPVPEDAYAHSKREAEEEISRIDDLCFTILRPPLVYGPGVRANFLQMMHWADTPLPLPLASLTNRRSLLYVENLADAVLACLQRRNQAHRKIWLLSDGPPTSVAALLSTLRSELRRPARLFPFPPTLLAKMATLINKQGLAQRLTGEFIIDDLDIRTRLDWQPPYKLGEALQKTIDWYVSAKRPSWTKYSSRPSRGSG